MNYTGEIAAVCTAIFWTITALAFERASLKIGSLSVNIIRLFLGFLFLSTFTWIRNAHFLPLGIDVNSWFWLIISGLIGFVFGDLFLFKSYTIIGSRFAMLIMTLVPPITAIASWIILKERLSFLSLTGMFLTVSGISLAIFGRNAENGKLKLKLSLRGILFAFGGAIGQAVGLVFSKLGMKDYDPFAATQIRLIAGMFGFTVLVTTVNRWSNVIKALKSRPGMTSTALGAFFGPFLGVSFSLIAIKFTQAGVASTIMAIVPVLIIPPAILIYKQKVTLMEVAGAAISIGGVALFFI